MKIKYTLVYEIDVADDDKNLKHYDLREMGYLKSLDYTILAKRYEKEKPKIISNTFELNFKGDALKIPN